MIDKVSAITMENQPITGAFQLNNTISKVFSTKAKGFSLSV